MWASFVMMIVSYAIQALIAPKPKTMNATAGTLDVPKAKEGDPIPVLFGTMLIKEPNVIWFGDAATKEIKSDGGGK